MVYARYPDLIRGPFRANVTPTWWTELIPTSSERRRSPTTRISWIRWPAATRRAFPGSACGTPTRSRMPRTRPASELAAYYQAIRDRDAAEFSRRASNVLTRIPAYATFNQHTLLARQRPGALAVRALARAVSGSAAGRAGSGGRLQHPCHDAGLPCSGTSRPAGIAPWRPTTSTSCSARCCGPYTARRAWPPSRRSPTPRATTRRSPGASSPARARRLKLPDKKVSEGRANRPHRLHPGRTPRAG